MNKKMIFAAAASAALLAFCYSPAQATYLTNHFFPAPLTTQLSDDSLEVVLTPGGTVDSSIHQGDTLIGQITFHSVQQSGNSGTAVALNNGMQVTAVFAATVSNVIDTGVPGPSRYALVLTPNAGFQAQFGVGAMAAVFENDSANPYNARTAGTFSQYFADAQSGTKIATVGFTGVGGTATGGEGWTSSVATLSTTPTASGFSIGNFTANVDLVGNTAAAGLLNSGAFQIAHSQGSFYGTGTPTQFLINGSLFSRPSGQVSANDGSGNPFPVGDNSSVFFQPIAVPEPASISLVALGLVTLGGLGYTKKRRKA